MSYQVTKTVRHFSHDSVPGGRWKQSGQNRGNCLHGHVYENSLFFLSQFALCLHTCVIVCPLSFNNSNVYAEKGLQLVLKYVYNGTKLGFEVAA